MVAGEGSVSFGKVSPGAWPEARGLTLAGYSQDRSYVWPGSASAGLFDQDFVPVFHACRLDSQYPAIVFGELRGGAVTGRVCIVGTKDGLDRPYCHPARQCRGDTGGRDDDSVFGAYPKFNVKRNYELILRYLRPQIKIRTPHF